MAVVVSFREWSRLLSGVLALCKEILEEGMLCGHSISLGSKKCVQKMVKQLPERAQGRKRQDLNLLYMETFLLQVPMMPL